MNHKITIEISGPRGSGKSTVARKIERMLKSEGESVLRIEDDGHVANAADNAATASRITIIER